MNPCEVRYSFFARTTNENGECHVSSFVVGERDGKALVMNEQKFVSFVENAKEKAALTETICVFVCDNLGFSMYALYELIRNNECRVLAKGSHSPISISIVDEKGKPIVVFLDLNVLCDCSVDKFAYRNDIDVGFDYESEYKISELPKLENRCKCMFRMLEEIESLEFVDSSRIGINIVTRTGLVREWQRTNVNHIKVDTLSRSVGQFASFIARKEVAKSDDELFCYNSCTRGGLTFVSEKSAFVSYDLMNSGKVVASFDAVSQYPAQVVGHMYPVAFHEVSERLLDIMFESVRNTDLYTVLNKFACPFSCAFDGLFRVKGLRPKPGSVFERQGIYTLQYSRCNEHMFIDDAGDMEFTTEFTNMLRQIGYKDEATNAAHRLGKLVSADVCELWLTELEAWILCQVYEFDEIEAVHGFGTMKFVRPTDLSVLSVVGLLDRKLSTKGTPMYESAKKDLNSVYGIEATNEARPSCVIGVDGIEVGKELGIVNLPRNPKAWYQMGQRVSGWGRVVQVISVMLCGFVDCRLVCGDTDSIKVLVSENGLESVMNALSIYGDAYRKAYKFVCKRVVDHYQADVSELEQIGEYRLEYVTKLFYSGSMKQYIYLDESGKLVTKIAGMRTKVDGFDNAYSDLANELLKRHDFADVCKLLMGFNVTIDKRVAKNFSIDFPDFGSRNEKGQILAPFVKPVGITVNQVRTDEDIEDFNGFDYINEGVYVYWEPGERPCIGRIDDVFGMFETEVL